MPDSQTKYPTILASLAGGGVEWNLSAGQGALTDSDNVYASVLLNPYDGDANSSQMLLATGYGFTIPAGKVINGIAAGIERHDEQTIGNTSEPHVESIVVVLYLAGVPIDGGENKALIGANWPSSDVVATYGDAADKWNVVPTITQLNSSTFGLGLQVHADLVGVDEGDTVSGLVDQIPITIYYSDPGDTTTPGRLCRTRRGLRGHRYIR